MRFPAYLLRQFARALKVEPNMCLTGASDSFVVTELCAGNGAVSTAKGSDHGQIVPEIAFRCVVAKLW